MPASVIAPNDLDGLIGKFDRRSMALNEADVKAAFIEPFFGLLGWDVHDTAQVGREAKTSAGRPDYTFRTGNRLEFLVEAKKPAENLAGNSNHALQLRRYAWTTDAPLSILTNFRELAVYDCRVQPKSDDVPDDGRILFAGDFDSLRKRWPEVRALFAREAVVNGKSLEKFRLKRKGSKRVDEALLEDVEGWRRELAHDIAHGNKLPNEVLNLTVQATIDRVLFLRICEDRGIEPEGQLRHLMDGRGIYRSLCYLFEQADEKYNSGLFHFQNEKGQHSEPDLVSLNLQITDRTLKGLLAALYLPKSAYDFSVLPVEVLGKVYERFLEKEIRLGPSGEARIYERPRDRKAGGVFYTEKWVVDYIVGETLSRLIDGQPLTRVDAIRVVDPACGSGSFLVAAYQRLLEWYEGWYGSNDSELHARAGRLYRDGDGRWRLAVPERKRILSTHIFGVDIDRQAIEVTKLSLLLKVLEGNADRQRRIFEERAMPDLSDNIKCGNSLIGLDFYRQKTLDGESKVNAFSWSDEFPKVFSGTNPGFDAVIGNPPYKGVAGRPGHSENIGEVEKAYFETHYETGKVGGQYDLYTIFLERAISLSKAFVGFIVPDGVLARDNGAKVREVILANAPPRAIADVGRAFEDAEASNVVLILSKAAQEKAQVLRMDESGVQESYPIDLGVFRADPLSKFMISIRPEDVPIIRHFVVGSQPLIDLYNFSRGEEIGKGSLDARGSLAILAGEDVQEFRVTDGGRRIAKAAVEKDFGVYSARKLLVRQTADTLIAAHDLKGFVTIKSLYNLVPKTELLERDWAICGILNSKLARFVFAKKFAYKLVYPQLNQNWVETFPVKVPAGTALATIGGLSSELSKLSALPESTQVTRRIRSVKGELEAAVFAFYGLSSDQVAVVERSLQ